MLAGVFAVGLLGMETAIARPRNPQAQPMPFQGGQPPAQMPREKRLQWVSEADSATAQRAPRMSREERRELRQEIHDAGRELYPHRRPRRGDE